MRWEGPLPPPATIEHYDRIRPGAAELIFRHFDEQGTHRRQLEQRVVGGSEDRARRGQVIAAGLLLLGIVAGTLIALTASAAAGAVVIGAALGSGALAYAIGGRPPSARAEEPSSGA